MAVSDYCQAGVPLPGACEKWADDAELIPEILGRIGGRWSNFVMVTLGRGTARYTDLDRMIPGLSQRMLTLTLTLTLKQLEHDGLVLGTAYAEVPPRVEYALTPLGSSLLSALRALSNWAVPHHCEIRANRERFDLAVLQKSPTKAMAAPRRMGRAHVEVIHTVPGTIR